MLATILWTLGDAAGAEPDRTGTAQPAATQPVAAEPNRRLAEGTPSRPCASDPVCVNLEQRAQASLRMSLFNEALYFFEAAYGRTYDPVLLLGMARTLGVSHQPLLAIRYYRLYLDSEDSDVPRREQAAAELAATEREVGIATERQKPANGGGARSSSRLRYILGGTFLAAGGSGLLMGLLSTLTNRTGLVFQSATSCSYGDAVPAKCFAPIGMEASGWALGIGFSVAGGLVLTDPLHLFSSRSSAAQFLSSSNEH